MRRAAVRRIAALGVLLLAGCAARREAVPLHSPDDERAAIAAAAPPRAVEEDPIGRIEEEPLLDEAAIAPGVGADGALAVEPPPLDHTIVASTAPNVAAATRLVEAGRAHMTAGEYGAALEQFERAIAVDPRNSYAYYYLAELHFLHRTYDQAIAFADRAAGLSENGAPEWASRAYALQGNAFEAAGRFADARAAYTRAIRAAPGNLAAQVGLTRVGAAHAVQP